MGGAQSSYTKRLENCESRTMVPSTTTRKEKNHFFLIPIATNINWDRRYTCGNVGHYFWLCQKSCSLGAEGNDFEWSPVGSGAEGTCLHRRRMPHSFSAPGLSRPMFRRSGKYRVAAETAFQTGFSFRSDRLLPKNKCLCNPAWANIGQSWANYSSPKSAKPRRKTSRGSLSPTGRVHSGRCARLAFTGILTRITYSMNQ